MKNYIAKITNWRGNGYRCGGPEEFFIHGRDNKEARSNAMAYIRECGIFSSRSTETLHRTVPLPLVSVKETEEPLDMGWD